MREAWDRRIQREDLRFGELLALLVNMLGRKENDPAVHPADFFASLEPLRPAKPTVEQEEAYLDSIFMALGGVHHHAEPR